MNTCKEEIEKASKRVNSTLYGETIDINGNEYVELHAAHLCYRTGYNDAVHDVIELIMNNMDDETMLDKEMIIRRIYKMRLKQ